MADDGSQTANVDPELRRQLDAAEPGEVIDVVFMLDRVESTPDEVEETVRGLLEDVATSSGHVVSDYNVFPNLSSFVVRADPDTLEELILRPEVGSAMANEQPDIETT